MHSDLVPFDYKQSDKTVDGVHSCSVSGLAFLCEWLDFHFTRASTFISIFMRANLSGGKPS